jgi:hypothetical protein
MSILHIKKDRKLFQLSGPCACLFDCSGLLKKYYQKKGDIFPAGCTYNKHRLWKYWK